MQWRDFSSHLAAFSNQETERIRAAFELGEKMHANQKRRSGEPYFTHPIAVAKQLIQLGADADTVIAALLHDTVEDTPTTLKEIKKLFGADVAHLIDGVTKIPPGELADSPRLDTKIETLRKIFHALEKDVRIIVIKLVDRLHNMQTLQYFPEEKRHAYAQETLDTYVKIADRLSMFTVRHEMEALCLAELMPEQFEALDALRVLNDKEGAKMLPELDRQIRHENKNGIVDMHFEQKTWQKLLAQHESKSGVTGVADMLLAIVVKNESDCYHVLGTLHRLWRREHLSFQDFINSPMLNGYQGLHTTIILEDGTRIRCKIRSEEMQKYAERGVCVHCFDGKSVGLAEYLPWAKYISPLSVDTKKRSDEFWENLKNDILGDSIIIHAIDDQAILIPEGSTLLDGAFYCYGDKALRLKRALINGNAAPLMTPLQNGATVTVELSAHRTVNLEWLYWAHTGVATAQIRQALTGQSATKKIAYGKQLLQEALTERGQGFLEEFDPLAIAKTAEAYGYTSADEAYSAIAQGHLESSSIVGGLIKARHPRTVKHDRQPCWIRVAFPMGANESVEQFVELVKAQKIQYSQLRIQTTRDGSLTRISAMSYLSAQEQKEIRHDLTVVGGQDVEIVITSQQEGGLLFLVILFWALNPVIAKWLLLESGVTYGALLSLRFVFFGVFAGLFYGIWRMRQPKMFKPIENGFLLSLRLATLSLILAALTYVAILYMPPSVHLTVMRFNILLLPFATLIQRRQATWRLIALHALLLIGSSALLLLPVSQLSPLGLLISVVTLISYMFYSLGTETGLQKNRVGARYPALLMQVGAIMAIVGIALLPFVGVAVLSINQWTQIGLYVLFCVFIPHAAFYAVLRHSRFKHVTDFFLLEVPIAMVAETLILGTNLHGMVYAVMTCILFAMFFLRIQISQAASGLERLVRT